VASHTTAEVVVVVSVSAGTVLTHVVVVMPLAAAPLSLRVRSPIVPEELAAWLPVGSPVPSTRVIGLFGKWMEED
jgi:hypothetical protein